MTTEVRGRGPELSVVIASVNGWGVLGPTLDAIDELPERERLEVVVVDCLGGSVRKKLGERACEVVVVESDRRSIPRLRYQGVIRSRGALVAILEDHARVDRGWAAAIFESHCGPWGAVGGPVENGEKGLVNWAVYFCEYATYMGPVIEGETADLPGNNIAYKRPHLLRHAGLLEEGKWESWINDRIRADGVPIASTNAMIVRHIKQFRFGYFLAQRFHFARSWAGMRRAGQTPLKRVIYGLGSMVLPVLLTARVTRKVMSKGRNVGQYLRVSPLVALFLTVGAVGEMAGYLIGPGGSLDKVE